MQDLINQGCYIPSTLSRQISYFPDEFCQLLGLCLEHNTVQEYFQDQQPSQFHQQTQIDTTVLFICPYNVYVCNF